MSLRDKTVNWILSHSWPLDCFNLAKHKTDGLLDNKFAVDVYGGKSDLRSWVEWMAGRRANLRALNVEIDDDWFLSASHN